MCACVCACMQPLLGVCARVCVCVQEWMCLSLHALFVRVCVCVPPRWCIYVCVCWHLCVSVCVCMCSSNGECAEALVCEYV